MVKHHRALRQKLLGYSGDHYMCAWYVYVCVPPLESLTNRLGEARKMPFSVS
jgi:hypothetical protein